MLIKVKRKANVPKITRFSLGGFPSIEFDTAIDEFEIPIEFLQELQKYFEPNFPVSNQEKKTSEFFLGKKKINS